MAPIARAALLSAQVVAGLLVGAPAAHATEVTAGIEGWRWPLSPPPVVVHPFEAPAGPYAAGHRGVDLAAAPGSRVLAAGAGVVAFAGWVAGRGVVSVDHRGGLRTTYEPVTPSVRRGDAVAGGQLLGLLQGSAGHCPPSACLHWGLRRGVTYLDPLSLLGRSPVRLLPVWASDLDRLAGAPAGGSPGAVPRVFPGGPPGALPRVFPGGPPATSPRRVLRDDQVANQDRPGASRTTVLMLSGTAALLASAACCAAPRQ